MMLKVAKLGIAIAAVLALIVPAAYAGVPDINQSFYAPQRGSLGTPVEGTAAAAVFRMCPNLDGFGFAGDNAHARIKVIVRDVNGVGIPGIAAADICVLFNGGTGVQGFSGVGADSVIANNTGVTNALCPNVRCMQADGPTVADGSTYITFRGNNGITTGQSNIVGGDRGRKWGHYDTDIPVYVLGFKLPGRMSANQGGASPAYILRVKNVDVAAGLNAAAGQAEIVTGGDVTAVLGALTNVNNPFRYWYDVDNNGSLTGADVTTVLGHLNHSCVVPTP